MNELTKLFSYQGNEVTFRNQEGTAFVNATEMSKYFGKLPNEYLRLPSAKELIGAIAGKSRISENQLVIVKRGSSENGGGTWLHETVALDFAQWLSVDFKLWCNDRIKELLTVGMTATPQTIEDMLTNPDLLIQMATQLKDLRAANDQKNTALLELNKSLTKVMPKVAYYDEVICSTTTITPNLLAQELGLSAIAFNRALRDKGILYRQGSKWLLVSSLRNKGYTDNVTHTFTRSNGEKGTDIQMRWTEKGREFIHQLFKN